MRFEEGTHGLSIVGYNCKLQLGTQNTLIGGLTKFVSTTHQTFVV